IGIGDEDGGAQDRASDGGASNSFASGGPRAPPTCEFTTRGPPTVSALAKDLISRLLKLEPMERYSARETLQHPWFASWKVGEDGAPEEVSTDQLSTVHEMMRGFIAARRLKRAGLVVLACGRFRLVALGWPSDGPCPNMAGCPSDAALQASDGGSDKSPGLRSIGAQTPSLNKWYQRSDVAAPSMLRAGRSPAASPKCEPRRDINCRMPDAEDEGRAPRQARASTRWDYGEWDQLALSSSSALTSSSGCSAMQQR
ncbi:hypothetical protein Ctob_013322, partial [Chrysochromulina tobinii]